MCGIFGIVIGEGSRIGSRALEAAAEGLFRLSEARGKESAGLAVRVRGDGAAASGDGKDEALPSSEPETGRGRPGYNIRVFKQPIPASVMIRSRAYKRIITESFGGELPVRTETPHEALLENVGTRRPPLLESSGTLIGHSRLVTNGAQERNDNNQPVIADGMVAVHNGIITNDAELWRRYPELKREYEVDTEVLLRLVGKFRRDGEAESAAVDWRGAATETARVGAAPVCDVTAAVRAAFGEIEGCASVAILFSDLDGLLLATNNGSLYTMRSRADAGMFVFASEAYILRTLAGRRALRGLFDARDVERIQPGEGWWVRAGDLGVERFSLGGEARVKATAEGPPEADATKAKREAHRLLAGATNREPAEGGRATLALEAGATSRHPHPALSLQGREIEAGGGGAVHRLETGATEEAHRLEAGATCAIVDVSGQYNGEFARHRVRAYSPEIVTRQDDPSLLTRHLPIVKALKRCTRCVLPETYPFITFDEHGVCNHCRHHRPAPTLGAEALREKVAPFRRGDDRPDCLVAVSGGRDSTYGLHYAKNVLGMNPIAYTYDWGMVTDLARRNISRICGKLGVEHLLVSADINRKRDNIRKNVLAWLRRPDLGVIPLFMAGDKTFFYYAKQVQKQTGVDLVIWCSGSGLESAHFKWLLGGVRRRVTDEGGQVDAARAARAFKLRLFAHYGRRFLGNPAYLNSSIWDTLFGYYAYYLLPRDFVYLYNYLPWDEKEILDVLIGEYGWEVSPDTRQTWRIGDGTASFYNYIYHTAAGFCENDTFRSEQVRRGKITRGEALAHLEEENRPRYESIKWYLSIIGLGDRFNRIIETINAIPKRYATGGQ